MYGFLNTVWTHKTISNLITKLPKRDAVLQKNFKNILLEYPRFRVLCPSIYTISSESIKSIPDNLITLQ